MGGIFGGGGGSSGAREAAEAQAAANREATAELRRQFEVTQGLLSPFQEAGTQALPRLQEASTIEGLESRLQQIFGTESFQALSAERGRAVQSQLAASGQSRSGTGLQEAARVPSELGLAIEGLLTGRTQDIVSGGQSAALGVAQAGSQNAQSIANILQSTGRSTAQGILTDAQASQQRGQNTLNLAGTIGGLFLGGALFGGSGASSRSLLQDPFSDPALKDNIEQIGACHDLKIYQWDWKEMTKGTIIEKCSTIGFMADEVKARYPQFVKEFCGFLTINYTGLLDHLEAS